MKERKYITNVKDFKKVVCDIEEQEITITRYRDDPVYQVFISDNTMLTKIKRVMKAAPEGYIKAWEGSKDLEGNVTGYFFEINDRCIAFKPGNKKVFSAETRAKRSVGFRERMAKSREARKANKS